MDSLRTMEPMELKFDRTDEADGRVRVWTNSRLRMLWLTSVRGYSISLTRTRPGVGILGGVRYHRRWLLVRRG